MYRKPKRISLDFFYVDSLLCMLEYSAILHDSFFLYKNRGSHYTQVISFEVINHAFSVTGCIGNIFLEGLK